MRSGIFGGAAYTAFSRIRNGLRDATNRIIHGMTSRYKNFAQNPSLKNSRAFFKNFYSSIKKITNPTFNQTGMKETWEWTVKQEHLNKVFDPLMAKLLGGSGSGDRVNDPTDIQSPDLLDYPLEEESLKEQKLLYRKYKEELDKKSGTDYRKLDLRTKEILNNYGTDDLKSLGINGKYNLVIEQLDTRNKLEETKIEKKVTLKGKRGLIKERLRERLNALKEFGISPDIKPRINGKKITAGLGLAASALVASSSKARDFITDAYEEYLDKTSRPFESNFHLRADSLLDKFENLSEIKEVIDDYSKGVEEHYRDRLDEVMGLWGGKSKWAKFKDVSSFFTPIAVFNSATRAFSVEKSWLLDGRGDKDGFLKKAKDKLWQSTLGSSSYQDVIDYVQGEEEFNMKNLMKNGVFDSSSTRLSDTIQKMDKEIFEWADRAYTDENGNLMEDYPSMEAEKLQFLDLLIHVAKAGRDGKLYNSSDTWENANQLREDIKEYVGEDISNSEAQNLFDQSKNGNYQVIYVKLYGKTLQLRKSWEDKYDKIYKLRINKYDEEIKAIEQRSKEEVQKANFNYANEKLQMKFKKAANKAAKNFTREMNEGLVSTGIVHKKEKVHVGELFNDYDDLSININLGVQDAITKKALDHIDKEGDFSLTFEKLQEKATNLEENVFEKIDDKIKVDEKAFQNKNDSRASSIDNDYIITGTRRTISKGEVENTVIYKVKKE